MKNENKIKPITAVFVGSTKDKINNQLINHNRVLSRQNFYDLSQYYLSCDKELSDSSKFGKSSFLKQNNTIKKTNHAKSTNISILKIDNSKSSYWNDIIQNNEKITHNFKSTFNVSSNTKIASINIKPSEKCISLHSKSNINNSQTRTNIK